MSFARIISIFLILQICLKSNQYGVTTSIKEKNKRYQKSLKTRITSLPKSEIEKIMVRYKGKSDFDFSNHSDYKVTNITYYLIVGNKLQNANQTLIEQKRIDYQILPTSTIKGMYKVYEEMSPDKNEISYFQEIECEMDSFASWSPTNYSYKDKVITQVRIESAKGIKIK